MTSRPSLPAAALLAAGGLVAASLAACSSSGGSGSGGSSAASGGSGSATTTDAKVANISITAADGCAADHLAFKAGGVTFKITNKDATAVSEVELLQGERIVGEKENLPPGFSGQFAVNVTAGDYTIYCPGAKTEKTTLTVTGKAAATGDSTVAALLAEGTKTYGAYVETQVGELLTSVTSFAQTLHGTDLAAAQKAYMLARPYYEKIEPVAESFVQGSNNLDSDIDVRIGDTTFAKWTGFHRIEYGLFKDKSLKGLSAFGDQLLSNVQKLQTLTKGLTYKPTELANGAQDLLDEVASSKITGEEEAYSQIDLLDFANNDEGAEQAFADLQPALTKIDPALTSQISSAFAALDKLVDTYRTGSNASGFVLYNQLTAADKTKLAAAVKAVQAPLSTVASKVANA
jgi:iron uptake system component EfeO